MLSKEVKGGEEKGYASLVASSFDAENKSLRY
jgi:hypothetical protein